MRTMDGSMKLTAGQKHLLRLVVLGKEPDGWSTVSTMLCKLFSENVPAELAILELQADGSGKAKLTDEGESVMKAMEWL
jgi:hypothetical protein